MQTPDPMRRMQPVLGTLVEIGIDLAPARAGGRPVSNARATAAMAQAFACLRRLHGLLSFQEPASQLTQLNQHPGRWLPLAPPVARVLQLAKAMTQLSDGLFNCTLAGQLVQAGKLPNHGGHCLASGDAGDVDIQATRARLRRPVRITLDGIAKGFAVDTAIAVLKRCGIGHGWINAGGDLRAFGRVQLPVLLRNAKGAQLPLCNLYQGAIATSQTGTNADLPARVLHGQQPAMTTTRSQTFSVAARFAWRADALTKVAANAPQHQAAARVAALGGYCLQPLQDHYHA